MGYASASQGYQVLISRIPYGALEQVLIYFCFNNILSLHKSFVTFKNCLTENRKYHQSHIFAKASSSSTLCKFKHLN